MERWYVSGVSFHLLLKVKQLPTSQLRREERVCEGMTCFTWEECAKVRPAPRETLRRRLISLKEFISWCLKQKKKGTPLPLSRGSKWKWLFFIQQFGLIRPPQRHEYAAEEDSKATCSHFFKDNLISYLAELEVGSCRSSRHRVVSIDLSRGEQRMLQKTKTLNENANGSLQKRPLIIPQFTGRDLLIWGKRYLCCRTYSVTITPPPTHTHTHTHTTTTPLLTNMATFLSQLKRGSVWWLPLERMGKADRNMWLLSCLIVQEAMHGRARLIYSLLSNRKQPPGNGIIVMKCIIIVKCHILVCLFEGSKSFLGSLPWYGVRGAQGGIWIETIP